MILINRSLLFGYQLQNHWQITIRMISKKKIILQMKKIEIRFIYFIINFHNFYMIIQKSLEKEEKQDPRANMYEQIHHDSQKLAKMNNALDDIFSKLQKLNPANTQNLEFKFKKVQRKKLKLKASVSQKWLPKYLSKKESKECESQNEQQQKNVKPKNKIIEIPSVYIWDFNLGKNIGSGKFGDVFLCEHKKTKSIYAIKNILKSTIIEYGLREQLANEIKIHKTLNHPNIIKLYTNFHDQFHEFLLMEYFPGKELLTYRKSEQKVVSHIIKQVIKAVQYLHRRGFAHRDLKPENILIYEDVIKICDFGWVADCNNGMRKTFCGTYDYVAPQVLQQKDHYVQVDIWAIGILTFQLLSGEVPFKNLREAKTFKNEKILYPWYFSDSAKEFISLFLSQNPEDRISLEAALTHSFIKDYEIKINPS